MIVFVDGKLEKKEYCKYKIKMVKGSDDYSFMREVVCRWYFRVLKEGFLFSDLIVVDGGKGYLVVV